MQLLRNKDIFPDEKILEQELGSIYNVYCDFIKKIKNEPFDLIPEWRFYNDGKSWLCKVVFKKKTIFWLSIWENFFKLSFYFTEKNSSGIFDLEINDKIRNDFAQIKKVGKLIPLIIDVNSEKQIGDILKIVEYKKKIK